MTDDDRPDFDRAFKRIALSFRTRMRADALDDLTSVYFRGLAEYPLRDVMTASDICLRQQRRFPKLADWREVIARSQVGAPPDVRVMTTIEASEYVRAERCHYDDDPCDCLLCRMLPHELRRRFVPDFTDDDREERAFCPPKNRVVVVGHWAHGDELARWHAARDAFFALAIDRGHAKVLRKLGFLYRPPAHAPRLSLVEREPGMEG